MNARHESVAEGYHQILYESQNDRQGVGLKLIQRVEPLSEQVYRHIRAAILAGNMQPGEKIVETKLATELEVSRSPVREAMQRLYTEQLLIEHEGAMCVFRPSRADFYELYDLRLAVEPMAARRAAENMNNIAIQRQLPLLERNLTLTRDCIENNGMTGLPQLNSEFHQTIWGMSNNSRFIRILANVSDLMGYYSLLVLNINNHQTNILEEHATIYQTLRDGNGDDAFSAMYNHITRDLEVVRDNSALFETD